MKQSPDGRARRGQRHERDRGRAAHIPGRAAATQVNGYLARPAEPGVRPGMIVIHEAMGLDEHIRDVANRFANLGYVALGVDLYTREGGPPPMDDSGGADGAPVLDLRRDRRWATWRAPPTTCAPART